MVYAEQQVGPEVTLATAPSAGDEVNLIFTVASDRDHRFCIYHTPMEPFSASILHVQGAGGETVEYRGRLIKRGLPQDRHYVTSSPNAPKAAAFNLAQWYPVESGKTYTVQFKGNTSTNGLPDSNVLEVSVP